MPPENAIIQINGAVADCVQAVAAVHGLTLEKFVERVLFEVIANDETAPSLPEPAGYDAYVREKVQEALANQKPDIPAEQVFADMRVMIEKVGRA